MTRTSRIAAGLVLIAGALLLATNAIHFAQRTTHWHAAQIIAATWGATVIAGVIGSFVRDRGERHRVAGVVIPSVGVALMLPLTFHLVAAFALGASAALGEGFDTWVLYSLIFVSVAHVVFAILVGLRAAAIAEGRIPLRVRTIYLATVTCAGVPGVILVIPMVFVAMTGLFILPLLHRMERWQRPLGTELPVAIARPA